MIRYGENSNTRECFEGRSSGNRETGKRTVLERTKGAKKTYNTRDSLVVTDPTTSPAVTGLSMGERTGSRAFQYLWSYVSWSAGALRYVAGWLLEVSGEYGIPHQQRAAPM